MTISQPFDKDAGTEDASITLTLQQAEIAWRALNTMTFFERDSKYRAEYELLERIIDEKIGFKISGLYAV